MAAQLLHAAGESVTAPVPKGTTAIALAAPNEQSLLDLESLLHSSGLRYAAIREPDRGNELMAIGIAPCEKRAARPYVSNYPLIR